MVSNERREDGHTFCQFFVNDVNLDRVALMQDVNLGERDAAMFE